MASPPVSGGSADSGKSVQDFCTGSNGHSLPRQYSPDLLVSFQEGLNSRCFRAVHCLAFLFGGAGQLSLDYEIGKELRLSIQLTLAARCFFAHQRVSACSARAHKSRRRVGSQNVRPNRLADAPKAALRAAMRSSALKTHLRSGPSRRHAEINWSSRIPRLVQQREPTCLCLPSSKIRTRNHHRCFCRPRCCASPPPERPAGRRCAANLYPRS